MPAPVERTGFAQFFVTRPVFAVVLSIVTVLVGGLALTALPISQYPDVVPPQVVITATFPGANAKTVADTVATPIEDEVNGVEDMLYMESQSTNDGGLRMTVTFKIGTDADKAQVLVQNRVSIAQPRLPEEVKRIGVTTKKQSSAILLVVNLYSEDDPATGEPKYDQLEVSNFSTLQIKDELARLPGVGDVFSFGTRDYSIRVWLDPDKMSDLNLSVKEVLDAIRSQNVQVSAGQIGQPPAPAGQKFQMVLNTQGRLPDARAFEEVIVKAGGGEQLIRLKDVVRDTRKVKKGKAEVEYRGIELGARNYDTTSTLDGRPSLGLPIFQLPGANAFETAEAVIGKMKELEKRFPEGMKYAIVYDPTKFVKASVAAVVQTLFEAVLLVFVVVLVFLQSWRAALIPMLAVPVALIGTFAAMYALGYSVNTLTLFGLVLAIGIVVDDAIVVVEAVESHVEKGLSPLDATREAMHEVAGAVIGVSTVLAAVFVPAAFIPGLTGQFFRQFAVVIAVSTLLSAFNSLTLSPALCPLLLEPHPPGAAHGKPRRRTNVLPRLGVAVLAGLAVLRVFGDRLLPLFPAAVPPLARDAAVVLAAAVPGYLLAFPLNWLLGWFFVGFNWAFEKLTAAYGFTVGWLMRLAVVVLVVYGGLLVLTERVFSGVPGGFIPQQDQGYLVINVELPDGASLERTEAVVDRVTDLCLGPVGPDGKRDRSKGVNGIANVIGVSGFSIFAQAAVPNAGGCYIPLLPFDERPGRTADMIHGDLQGRLTAIQEGRVNAFPAPPIIGLGNAGGFKLQVRDRGGLGLETLEGMTKTLMGAAMKEPGIPFAFTSFSSGAPQAFLRVDRDRVRQLGIDVADVNEALQTYLGSTYVNDVTLFDRNWQVNVQADAQFRTRLEDLNRLKVRAPDGRMVPLSGVVTVKNTDGPVKVNRYQKFPAADVNGIVIAQMLSSGQALAKMEALSARELPDQMDFLWTDMAYQQKMSENSEIKLAGVTLYKGDTTVLVFGISALAAFLVLAALYESWLLPLAIVLIVPMCLMCAAFGLTYRQLDLNIFTQVGLVVLVGLSCKNAILIVEFAKQKRAAGESRFDAAKNAARQRLRPILMTSFAFILGVLPLVRAEGPGAEMRRALGTAVFAGMIGVTIFGVFFTPVFYLVMQWLGDLRGRKPAAAAPPAAPGKAGPVPAAVNGQAAGNGDGKPAPVALVPAAS